MKNETKQNEQKLSKQDLSTRNTRSQEESKSINAIAWGRPTIAPYDRQYEIKFGDSHLQLTFDFWK